MANYLLAMVDRIERGDEADAPLTVRSDALLARLRKVHKEPRYDLAPELLKHRVVVVS